MHNTIYEVATPEMINEGYKPKLSERTYDDYEDGPFDYVEEMDAEEVEKEKEEFEKIFGKLFNFKNDFYEVTDNSAKEYFAEQYKGFKECVDNIDLDVFCGKRKDGRSYMHYFSQLEDSIERKTTNYVYIDGGTYTMDDFMRWYRGRFVIVNAMDYHR